MKRIILHVKKYYFFTQNDVLYVTKYESHMVRGAEKPPF